MLEFDLGPRQREVVRHLFRGHRNGEIAYALGIKENTVKRHLRDVFRALDVDSRERVILRLLALY